MPAKKGAALGFDLNELSHEVARYDSPQENVRAQDKSQTTERTMGRPKTFARGTVPLSVRITHEQRTWLLHQAARQMLETGDRKDASQVVRELIDQARASAA